MNGEDCLFGLCFGISFMSGVYFAHLVYSFLFSFFFNLRNYNQILTKSLHDREFYLNILRQKRNDY